jgi:hypothetical protein
MAAMRFRSIWLTTSTLPATSRERQPSLSTGFKISRLLASGGSPKACAGSLAERLRRRRVGKWFGCMALPPLFLGGDRRRMRGTPRAGGWWFAAETIGAHDVDSKSPVCQRICQRTRRDQADRAGRAGPQKPGNSSFSGFAGTARTGSIALSRWRHGFESRWGCSSDSWGTCRLTLRQRQLLRARTGCGATAAHGRQCRR